jgi:acyl-coenzyme A thioesterase PaaI-like protein
MSEIEISSAEIIRRLSEAPMARWLNYSVESDERGLLHKLGFSEQHIGNPAIRALHGGVIASFLELACQVELCAKLGEALSLRAISNSIDYMASSKAQDMKARVSIARAGRRIAFLEATGWQNDETRPVATARVCLRIGEDADK